MIEHRNEKVLLEKNGITLARVDIFQTGFEIGRAHV